MFEGKAVSPLFILKRILFREDTSKDASILVELENYHLVEILV